MKAIFSSIHNNIFISDSSKNRDIQFESSSKTRLNLNGALEVIHEGEYKRREIWSKKPTRIGEHNLYLINADKMEKDWKHFKAL